MKRMFLLAMVIVICVNVFVGCNQKIPEGIENKEFYKDMVSMLPELEKGLKQKNISYYEKLHGKYLGKYYRKDLNISLNDKELDIREAADNVLLNYKLYVSIYLNSEQKYDSSKLIDVDKMFGEELLKSAQKLIGLLCIDYELQ